MQAAGEGPARRPMRATVAYDGTDFLGFQLQADGRTVQGVLEAALRQVTDSPAEPGPRVIGSGRTDAGVHATGQVIGFRVAWRHPVPDLLRALNAVLPPDVVLLDLAPAAEHWHARFSAVQRDYAYTVLNSCCGRWSTPCPPGDCATGPDRCRRLRPAGGEHDFASFGQRVGETTVRRTSKPWRQEGGRLIRGERQRLSGDGAGAGRVVLYGQGAGW